MPCIVFKLFLCLYLLLMARIDLKPKENIKKLLPRRAPLLLLTRKHIVRDRIH